MSRVDSHVAAVRRRLTLGIYIQWLAMAAFVLAVLSFLVILSERILHIALPPQLIWVGVGAVAVAAGIMAILHAPSADAAAVAIDEKLGLKEKFSTALKVKSSSDPFAQAVVLDAERTAGNVHLAGRFPFEFPRAGYWCICAAALALLALWFMPEVDLFGRKQALKAMQEQQANIAIAERKIREAIVRIEQLPEVVQQSEKVQLAKGPLNTFLKNPTPDIEAANLLAVDAKDKAAEAALKQIDDMKVFANAQKASRLLGAMNNPLADAKGLVASVAKDLKNGDLEEAHGDLLKLATRFTELDKTEQELAAAQMQKLAEALKAIADDPQAMQNLPDQLKQADVNQQQIQELIQQATQGDPQSRKELQQIQQQAIGQLARGAQKMAKAMDQACKDPGAQQAGEQMADGIQKMQEQLEQMQRMQEDLRNAQRDLEQQLAQGDGQGQWKPGNQQGKGQQAGGGGAPPGFGGPQGKTASPYTAVKVKSPVQVNENGKQLASVFVKDNSVNPGKSRLELAEIITAGQADEGGDVDDSRADNRARNAQKNYFRTLADGLKQ